MEKNQFLMINDIIYDIYSWEKLSDINETFFNRLQMLLPFSYGSTREMLPLISSCPTRYATRLILPRLNRPTLSHPMMTTFSGFFMPGNLSSYAKVT